MITNDANELHATTVREICSLNHVHPHPNIVQLVDYFMDSSFCFLILKQAAGNLGRARQGKLALSCLNFTLPTKRAQLLYQISSAVAHIHQKGLFHRDIKCSNILVFAEPMMPINSAFTVLDPCRRSKL